MEMENGGTRFEVVWNDIGDTIHKVLDLGASSWPVNFLVFDSERGGLGGTFDCDAPHRRHRHHLNSVEHSNMTVAMNNVHLVLTTFKAPYARIGFFGTFRSGTTEFFREFGIDSEMFEGRDPRLSHWMAKGKHQAEFGTVEHKQKVVKLKPLPLV